MWGKEYGGIGRYTKEIVSYLINNESWSFTLLCYINYADELIELVSSSKNKSINLKFCKAPLFSIKAQLEFIRQVPRCDILWVPSINIPIVPTRAKSLVATIHDVFQLAHPEYYSKPKLAILKLFIGRAIRKSSMILTVSDFSLNEIIRFYGNDVRNKIHRIYNGFTPISVCKIENTQNNRYILYVGNIKPHKNLKNALLGYELYYKNNTDDLKFVIVGKRDGFVTADKDVDLIVKRINNGGNNVIFEGNIEDEKLFQLYKNATLFIQPSYYEGFGIPLIEAMCFGIPIICSDIPVFREICGNQVTYFNPDDKQSIAQSISFSINNKVKCNYAKWRSWEETGRDVAKLLQEELNIEDGLQKIS